MQQTTAAATTAAAAWLTAHTRPGTGLHSATASTTFESDPITEPIALGPVTRRGLLLTIACQVALLGLLMCETAVPTFC
jgi:hypothetical protein